MTDQLRVLVCTPEAVPFAKTGGLADVAAALPQALAEAGCDVRVVMPAYRTVDTSRFGFRPAGEASVRLGSDQTRVGFWQGHFPGSAVPVYLIDHPPSFDRDGLYVERGADYEDNLERFTVFGRGILALVERGGWSPHVLHCQDWQTALLPVWLRAEPRPAGLLETATLLTIHNLAYQGLFPAERLAVTGLSRDLFTPQGLEFYGKINLLKGGIIFADLVSTVSEQYAREIQTPEFGCGLDGVLRDRARDLIGILNGVDYTVWDPAVDPHIPARYTARDLSGKRICKETLQRDLGLDPDAEIPLLGMISRLVDQKGLDLVAATLEIIVGLDAEFVLLGTGEPRYHDLFSGLHARYPTRVAVTLGFDEVLAHRIEAGADIFLMPSRFEPSGLNQLYSMRYGTLPVVRRTGGLADTVVDATSEAVARGVATGFVFDAYTPDAFLQAVKRALWAYRDRELWQRLQVTAMGQDFSWRRSASRYIEAYRRAMAVQRERAAHR